MGFMANIRRINSSEITEENVEEFIPRTSSKLKDLQYDVMEIVNEVIINGDQALIDFTEKFDHISLEKGNIMVTKEEIKEAYENIDNELLEALRFAKKNLITFHEAQVREEWFIDIIDGVKAGQVARPIDSVGLYIPGGKAIYPSTVLMAAAPAKVAGVKDITLCSPPQQNGTIALEIIVAANEFGIDKMFKIGGVQAIAAMAHGTETIPKVLKVVGPGNKWVNAAKQLLSNIIAIDNPAGPSEIMIIADKSANYEYVLIDFISQLEHDPENMAAIITDSEDLLENVEQQMDSYIQNSKRKEIIASALNNSLLIMAEDIEECVRVSNIIAPEHLEILTTNPKQILEKINNAGAIFLGSNSPVPLGDYSAGTNHILPTGGYAKTYSGLNTLDFVKLMDVLECSREGLKNLSSSAMKIAEYEKLFAHRESIQKRLEDKS
ncbi:MAG: bifunctional histidinal dehydrogenase and histidinol dehydrogenase [Promethearchaeota archaeon]|nr:MAG: bifunctional histidinal dehydrogenase and histidinol dehydrogenase [Candidatus Lokiarchaeota archaeon]